MSLPLPLRLVPLGVLCAFTACSDGGGTDTRSAANRPDAVFAIGGDGDDLFRDVAVDADGFAYAAGGTSSSDLEGASPAAGQSDILVVKWSPTGERLWTRVIGTPGVDRAYALEIGPGGDVIVAGRADEGLPTTPDGVQPAFGGGTDHGSYGNQDGFVLGLGPDGALRWASYLGSSENDAIRDVAVDASGDIYLYGRSFGDLPVALRGAFGDDPPPPGKEVGVLVKLAKDGRSVLWARWVGGGDTVAGEGSVVAMPDGHVTMLTAVSGEGVRTTPDAFARAVAGDLDFHVSQWTTGGELRWATVLGGSGPEHVETHNLGVDASGHVVIASGTESADFPVTADAFQRVHAGNGGHKTGRNTNYSGDGVVARLSPDGSRLVSATFLGGGVGDSGEGVAVTPDGTVCMGGVTFSDDFPTAVGASEVKKRHAYDGFGAVLAPGLDAVRFVSVLGTPSGSVIRAATVSADGDCWLAGKASNLQGWPDGRSRPDGSVAIVVRLSAERWRAEAATR